MYGRRQLAIFKGGCHETERGGMHVEEALEGVHSTLWIVGSPASRQGAFRIHASTHCGTSEPASCKLRAVTLPRPQYFQVSTTHHSFLERCPLLIAPSHCLLHKNLIISPHTLGSLLGPNLTHGCTRLDGIQVVSTQPQRRRFGL